MKNVEQQKKSESILGEKFIKFPGPEVLKKVNDFLESSKVIRELDELKKHNVQDEEILSYAIILPEYEEMIAKLMLLSLFTAQEMYKEIETKSQTESKFDAVLKAVDSINYFLEYSERYKNMPILSFVLKQYLVLTRYIYLKRINSSDFVRGFDLDVLNTEADSVLKRGQREEIKKLKGLLKKAERVFKLFVSDFLEAPVGNFRNVVFQEKPTHSLSQDQLIEKSMFNDFEPFKVDFSLVADGGVFIDADEKKKGKRLTGIEVFRPGFFQEVSGLGDRTTGVFSVLLRTSPFPTTAQIKEEVRKTGKLDSAKYPDFTFLTFDSVLGDFVKCGTLETLRDYFISKNNTESDYERFKGTLFSLVYKKLQERYELSRKDSEESFSEEEIERAEEEIIVEDTDVGPVENHETGIEVAEDILASIENVTPKRKKEKRRLSSFKSGEVMRKMNILLGKARVEGSHHIYSKEIDEKRVSFVFPFHFGRDIPKPYVYKALKIFKISREEFLTV